MSAHKLYRVSGKLYRAEPEPGPEDGEHPCYGCSFVDVIHNGGGTGNCAAFSIGADCVSNGTIAKPVSGPVPASVTIVECGPWSGRHLVRRLKKFSPEVVSNALWSEWIYRRSSAGIDRMTKGLPRHVLERVCLKLEATK